jgi:hypothetical protein
MGRNKFNFFFELSIRYLKESSISAIRRIPEAICCRVPMVTENKKNAFVWLLM